MGFKDDNGNDLVKFNVDYEENKLENNKKSSNERTSRNNNFLIVIVEFVVIIALLVGGYFLLREKEYVVSFDTSGGSTIPKQVVSKGNVVSKPKDPTRDGYVFITWSYNDDVYNFNGKVKEDIKLIAVWEKVEGDYFVVTFNSNGGSEIANQVITAESNLVEPKNPTRDGYNFKYWSLNGNKFDFSASITEDITLTAEWEEVKNNNNEDSTGASTNNVTTRYGDANEDGVVDSRDATAVLQHDVGKRTLTGQALKNADINGDGKVNKVDAQLILGYEVELIQHDINKPLTNYVLYGDAGEDGEIDSYDATLVLQHVENSKSLLSQAMKNADVNGDGKVNKVDAQLILAIDVELYSHNIFQPLKNYILYGDVDENGEVDNIDAMLIARHNEKLELLTGQALKNGDVNADGKVNVTDQTLVLEFYVGNHPGTLPFYPIK